MRKHMFDGAANLRLLSIGNARTLGHGLALWLLAVDARYEPASFQHRLVPGRAISRVRPHLTGCIVAVENVLQSRAVVSGGMRRCPFADQTVRAVDRDVMEWMPPPDGITMCQGGDVCASHEWKRTSMEKVSLIGLDLAKRAFQAHGARADGGVAFRKKL